MPSAAPIDTSFAGDTNIKLLEPYGVADAGVEIIHCRKTVYVPSPYMGLLLCTDLSLVEARKRLCGAIADTADEAACQPLIDWLL